MWGGGESEEGLSGPATFLPKIRPKILGFTFGFINAGMTVHIQAGVGFKALSSSFFFFFFFFFFSQKSGAAAAVPVAPPPTALNSQEEMWLKHVCRHH